jgi:hypothetical protein
MRRLGAPLGGANNLASLALHETDPVGPIPYNPLYPPAQAQSKGDCPLPRVGTLAEAWKLFQTIRMMSAPKEHRYV